MGNCSRKPLAFFEEHHMKRVDRNPATTGERNNGCVSLEEPSSGAMVASTSTIFVFFMPQLIRNRPAKGKLSLWWLPLPMPSV